ncbi:MAG: twin-arginine translocase subunit TatC [Chloroflexi bacterium]|nr:twin-arginine translocase subunit TatC [Chloroflexota bacterium]
MTSNVKTQPPPYQEPDLPPEEGEEDDNQLRMSLLDHLGELRTRITRAGIALILGTVIGILVAGEVLLYLQEPYGDKFIMLGPTDSVVAYFRVSLMVGGILAIPMITYQFLMFVLPGLTRREKRYFLSALPAITGLFVIGALFAWFVLVPPAINFLEGFQEGLFEAQWTAERYLAFVTTLIFWMGVAFETPLVFFVLSILGMATARALLRSWRVAIVGAAVAAALITPTIDPVNMVLVMGPLLALYLLSIVLVLIGRRFSRLDTKADYELE